MPRSLFQVVGVHDALCDACWLRGKGAGLAQKFVDQRGLAVVDVGDNGDVAESLRVMESSAAKKVAQCTTGRAAIR